MNFCLLWFLYLPVFCVYSYSRWDRQYQWRFLGNFYRNNNSRVCRHRIHAMNSLEFPHPMELILLNSKWNFTENQQQLRKMTLRNILSFPKLTSIKHISTGYLPHTVDLEYKEKIRTVMVSTLRTECSSIFPKKQYKID